MLPELIAGLGVRPADPKLPLEIRICDLTDDSRTVVPGSLFIARKGTKTDGGRFVADAVASGAVAVVSDDPLIAAPASTPLLLAQPGALAESTARMAERFYGDPTTGLVVIGVTGTKGKTTTAHLIHQILNSSGVRCGLIGTVVVDDGTEVAPATLTTPPAAELSRTFARMLDAGCRAAAMEVSSHALDQGRVAAVRFSIGVFTNLSGDHLDYHATMERYARAKARLFEVLPPSGAGIVNADDPGAAEVVGRCGAPLLRCSLHGGGACPTGGCRACVASSDRSGTIATFAGPWGEFGARLLLIGRHNVMNALQAIAACWAAGLGPEQLKAGVERAASPPGRLEPVTAEDAPFSVLVDYAHTDDAIRKALEAVRPLVGAGGAGGRLRIVFGCGGDRDRTKRPRMGAAAIELADVVYVTSDNPRSEDPGAIIREILSGVDGSQRHRLHIEPDRRAAIERAIEDASAGDIVVIAGKGHETYQILPDGRGGTMSIAFDDREEARRALERRGPGARP